MSLKNRHLTFVTGDRGGERYRGRVDRARGRGRKETAAIAIAREGPHPELAVAAVTEGLDKLCGVPIYCY